MSGTQWVSHPVFFDAPFSWGHTGACAPLGANVWHPMGVTLFFWDTHILKPKNRCTRATGCRCLVPNGCPTQFFLMHPFLGDTQVHARHWVPMSGTQWVSHCFFWDTHILKPKKQVHARHWVPMFGTQWVSHPVFFDAPFSWGHTGALPMSGTQWVSHHFFGIHTF